MLLATLGQKLANNNSGIKHSCGNLRRVLCEKLRSDVLTRSHRDSFFFVWSRLFPPISDRFRRINALPIERGRAALAGAMDILDSWRSKW